MSATAGERLTLLDLLGRRVQDANGKDIGRVWDVEAALDEDRLRIVALVVGASGMLGRFGWTKHSGGRRVPWENVGELSPRVTLRGSAVPWS